MFRTALLILSGNAFFSLMSFVRNLLVARLLGIEGYGIAATFAISLAIVEMLSELGLRKIIVQDRQGDDPRMQATLQGFQLLRAMIAATALFLLAHPLAGFLRIPEVAWAYQVMALVPLLNGLVHFDLHRMQRQMKFTPSILGRTGPALASVLLVWPLFLVFGDYRVMLWALIGQMTLMVIASHLLAERRFQLGFDPTIIRRSLRFGWPLLINAALIFLVLHGEKLVVGRELGMEMLAIFVMGFSLSFTPLRIPAKSLSDFFLPQLSGAQDNALRYNRLVRISFQAYLAVGTGFALLLASAGPAIVDLLLGDSFAALGPLMAWLGILNAVRVFKSASGLAAFARGRTSNTLWGNLPRAASLPLMWYVLIQGGDLLALIWIGLIGEVAGFFVSLALLYRQPIIRLRPLLLTLVLNLASLLALAAGAEASLLSAAPHWAVVVANLVAVGFFIMSLFVAHDLQAYVGRLFRRG